MSVYTTAEIAERIRPVAKAYGIDKVYLFGSYAKGTAAEKSDVDLMVDSGLHGLKFVGLLEELREALRKDVDLFDISHIESGSPIDKEIRATGMTIYEK